MKKMICILGVLLMLGMVNVLANSVSSVQYADNSAVLSYCHDTAHDHHVC